jgi:hypothetical protein
MGPFCLHIVDAICINIHRLFLYAKLTWGKSIPVSVGLILFEVTILPLAFYYDLINRMVWKKKGWNLLNEDFIDMKWTPEFKTKRDDTSDIPCGEYRWLPVAKWRNEINRNLKQGNWKEAHKGVKALRESLSLSHKTFPLVHHFLESVHRCIALTTIWKNERKKIGQEEESFLLHRRRLVWWQMVGFEGALILDFLSFKMRGKGLLILEQDVPVIPVPKV